MLAFSIIMIAVATVTMVVLLKMGMRDHDREQALLHAIPRTSIGNLVEGVRVRIVGTVVAPDEYVKAPYTGRLCVAFHAESEAVVATDVDYELGSRKTFRAPVEERVLAFHVRDETGVVGLDVAQVTLALQAWPVSGEHAFGAEIIARNAAHTEYEEALLVADTPVAVIGLVQRGADGTLRLVGTEHEPLVVSNQSGALQT